MIELMQKPKVTRTPRNGAGSVLLILLAAYLANAARMAFMISQAGHWAPEQVFFGIGVGLLWLPIAVVAAVPLLFSSPAGAFKLFVFVAFGIQAGKD